MPKFTPEPWDIRRFDESQTAIIAKVSDKSHPLICIVSIGEGCPNGEANARLLVKAPDMYAIVKAMTEQQDIWADSEDTWDEGYTCRWCGDKFYTSSYPEEEYPDGVPQYHDDEDCPGYKIRKLLAEIEG